MAAGILPRITFLSGELENTLAMSQQHNPCLMTANVLSRSSGDPEIAGFYENYDKLDSEKAKLLKNIRKDGQYLVAICDYYS
jgi:hypothetical protein